MSMTLTNLIPDLYSALDVVSREMVGLIPAVTLDAKASQAAVNQSVYAFVAPTTTADNLAAGQDVPDAGDQTIGNVEVKITKSRFTQLRWSGEDEANVSQGFGARTIRVNQLAQCMRVLTNEIEADLAALNVAASRAYGTAGTAPFGTAGDYTDGSNMRKILVDNGAPTGDLHMVLNTSAGSNLRGKQGGRGVDAEGTTALLRQGVLQDIHGFALRESAQIATSTAGTASSATVNADGYAVGATTLTLSSAGTGTLVAGDVVTFAGDTNKYVLVSGDADVSGGGTIVLAAPGLRVAMSTATKAITVVAAAARNMAFSRNAIVLAHRLPTVPEAGDKAIDRDTITDARSGMSFEIAMYPGFRRMNWLLSCNWGVKCVKPEHLALLLG